MLRLLAILCATLVLGAQDTPARARDAYERGLQLEREGNISAALSLYWEAAGMAPRDPDIQYHLGGAIARRSPRGRSSVKHRTASS
jgi:hypothetical protein